MAENKRTHRINLDTNLRELADFPEVKDKIIDGVEVSNDLDHFDITISFQDKTTLVLIVEPCTVVFPILSQWEDGEEKILKVYKPVRSKIPDSEE